jgi:hypothetical protein
VEQFWALAGHHPLERRQELGNSVDVFAENRECRPEPKDIPKPRQHEWRFGVFERCTPDEQPLLQLGERITVVLPAQLTVLSDPKGREVVVDVGLLVGEPAVEEQLAAYMADGTSCPTPHTCIGQLGKRVLAQCVERGRSVECPVGPVVQVDSTLNVRITNLDQGDSYHRLEVGQHAAEKVPWPLV